MVHTITVEDYSHTKPLPCPDCGCAQQHTENGCANHNEIVWCEDTDSALDHSDNTHDPRGHWHYIKPVFCECKRTDINIHTPEGYTHNNVEYRIAANCSVCGPVSWHLTISEAESAGLHHIETMERLQQEFNERSTNS